MKYYGKEKCRILKEIRAEIAQANDIEWVVSECKHQGNCKGTCPKCEQEVRELEEALAKREALGKKVAVVGISAALSLSVTGCDLFSSTAGDMAVDGEPYSEEIQSTAGLLVLPETDTEVAVDGEMLPVPGEELPNTETAETAETAETDTEESETDETESETESEESETVETDMGEPAW